MEVDPPYKCLQFKFSFASPPSLFLCKLMSVVGFFLIFSLKFQKKDMLLCQFKTDLSPFFHFEIIDFKVSLSGNFGTNNAPSPFFES